MNNHICVLFCFYNTHHIKQCYESLKNQDVDFFIVENKSENSEEIHKYFKEQNILGHIRFEDNITFRAIELFVKDYYNLLTQYNYITISDCDLKLTNSQDTFSEIIKNLNLDNVGISCVDLSLENFPSHIEGSKGWIPSIIGENDEYIECATGIHLCTIKKENLYLFKQTFIDSFILRLTYSNSLKWVKTKKNKAIHLTWDLYTQGNEYFEFKKNTPNLWNHSLSSNYNILK
jgi:hypothetical protein